MVDTDLKKKINFSLWNIDCGMVWRGAEGCVVMVGMLESMEGGPAGGQPTIG